MLKNRKILSLWLWYFVKGLFGSRRFLGLSPPFIHKQIIYDREQSRFFSLFVRDDDDWIQLENIFLNEEFKLDKTGRKPAIDKLYRSIMESGSLPLIIDLGANIGLASKYLELAYPGSKVLAVEPETGNCRITQRNLPDRSLLFNAAIGSAMGTAELIDTGRNCGFRVVQESGGGGRVKLMTVQEVMESAAGAVPFLIKIDIEGFENDLFSRNTDWIDLFPILLIELHDWMLPGSRVTRNFLQEIARREREFMHFDGYVVSLKLPEDTLHNAA